MGGDEKHFREDKKLLSGDEKHLGGDEKHFGGDEKLLGWEEKHLGEDEKHLGGDDKHLGEEKKHSLPNAFHPLPGRCVMEKFLTVFFIINIAQKRYFSCRLGISQKRVVLRRVESCSSSANLLTPPLRTA